MPKLRSAQEAERGRMRLEQREEMLRYFSRPGFSRLFREVKRKYQSLGRVGGRVRLNDLTPEEQEALSGFFGANYLDQTSITIEVARVDAILRASRFEIELASFLPAYFDEDIPTNAEQVAAESQEWEYFIEELTVDPRTPETAEWLRLIRRGQGYGYRTVRSLYQENKEQAADILKTCLTALDLLPVKTMERCRIPVYAARLTGDPHALDRDTPLGRLLFCGMLYVLGLPDTDYQSEKKRAIFRRAGLEEDDLSSNVITAGLKTLPGDTRASLFQNALETGSPLILPLRFFERPTEWCPLPVYVVENPSVFSAILDTWAGPGLPAMVCTSGQPSVAALKLLDQLVQGGTRVYYSGDFDVKGLEMGAALYRRYGSSFIPWLFDTRTYLDITQGTILTAKQRQRLVSFRVPWDHTLTGEIMRRGLIVYQESLVTQMISQLLA
ncbi:MAG: TIGR02679 family protein [Bacillota bacterium]